MTYGVYCPSDRKSDGFDFKTGVDVVNKIWAHHHEMFPKMKALSKDV